jgi:hypothetical protein
VASLFQVLLRFDSHYSCNFFRAVKSRKKMVFVLKQEAVENYVVSFIICSSRLV